MISPATANEFADFILMAASCSEPMPEVRVITLAHYAFEHEYPKKEVSVHPQIFNDNGKLSIALDIDMLDEFTYESVLQVLLNISEDVSLNDLQSPCYFGNPVAMKWHDHQQQYVRGNPLHVSEFSVV